MFCYDVNFVVFRKREKRIEECDVLPVDTVREADRSRNVLGRCRSQRAACVFLPFCPLLPAIALHLLTPPLSSY